MPSTTACSCCGRRLVAKPNDGMEPELVARGNRLEADARDLAVRDAHHGAIERTNAGRTQADVIDGAHHVPHLQDIADPDGLIEDERRAGDDVFERLLRRERHRNAPDAQPGQRRREIHAEVAQGDQHAAKITRTSSHPAEQPHEGRGGGQVRAREAPPDVAARPRR